MRKTIKKLTAVGLTLTSVMGLVACGNNNASNGTKETVDWASVEKPEHFTVMVDGTVPTLEEWGEKFDEQLKSLTGLDLKSHVLTTTHTMMQLLTQCLMQVQCQMLSFFHLII